VNKSDTPPNPADREETPSAEHRFFELLSTHPRLRVRAAARPHCQRWIEEWRRHRPGDDDGSHDPLSQEHTLSFFEALGRNRGLKGWHFHQAIRAVELWTTEVEPVDWAKAFDWASHCDQVRDLEANHRTLLREVEQSALAEYPPGPDDHRPAPDEERIIAAISADSIRRIRLRKLAVATETTYLPWIKRYARFCLRRAKMAPMETIPVALPLYLDYLALERQVAEETQRVALNAIVFLARHVAGIDDFQIEFHKSRVQSKRPKTVLSRQEIDRIFGKLSDPWKLISQVAYGSGLRQMATLRLRVKDLDFAQGTIFVHDAKGGKHRVVPLPKALEGRLQRHLKKLKAQHEQNLAIGEGVVHGLFAKSMCGYRPSQKFRMARVKRAASELAKR